MCKKKKVLLFAVVFGFSAIIGFYSVKKIRNKYLKNNYFQYQFKAWKNFREGFVLDSLKFSDLSIIASPENPNGYFIKIRSLLKLKEFDEVDKLLEKVKGLCVEELDKTRFSDLENEVKEEKKTFNEYLEKYETAQLIKPFLKETYKKGIRVVKNDIFYGNYGVRGVRATDDIKAGEILVEVPRNALLFSSDAKKFILEKYSKADKLKPEDIEYVFDKCNRKSTFYLALYILENQNREDMKEYVKMMFSNNYDSFPSYFDDVTLKLIKNTGLEYKLNELEKDLVYDYDTLKELKSVQKYDFNTMKRMYFTVCSRNFGWDFADRNEMILSPYLDLFNHSKKNDRWYFDEKKNTFCLEAITDIKKGEELYDTYGVKKSNARLLLSYGFTSNANKDNAEAMIMFNEKSFICRQNVNKKDEDNELIKLIESLKSQITEKDNKLSKLEIEKQAFEQLNSLCQDRIKGFNTTLEEDEKYFKANKDKISFNEMNCYIVIIEEKKVLNWLKDFSGKVVKMLSENITFEDVLKKIKEDKNVDYFVKEYFSNNTYLSEKK